MEPLEIGSGASLAADFLRDVGGTLDTPAFVFTLESVRARARDLLAIMPRDHGKLLYAVKAQPTAAIIEVLHAEGVGVDVCSIPEAELARSVGVPSRSMSFMGVAPTAEELDYVISRRIPFIADSLEGLHRFHRSGGTGAVGIRLKADVVADIDSRVLAGGRSSKFGVDLDDLERVRNSAQRVGLEIETLHCHLGSDILSPDVHRQGLRILMSLVPEFPALRWLDIGGGYGIPMFPGERAYELNLLGAALSEAAEQLHGSPIGIILEPGAFLVRESGHYLTRVIETRDGREGRTAYVDGSTNHLLGVLLFGTQHPVRTLGCRSGEPVPTRVAGNLMLGGDILAESASLPSDLAAGDVLVFGLAGAYSAARSSTFNGRPLPAVYAVDGSGLRELSSILPVDYTGGHR